ncbi:sugar phosphate isomerase [Weissella oryzae SG25]|uniref:Sugar phosphate isomerase n=1 Tax=Weissella oryzae (strain DSM 25784 / JCM 18191 / LMG 30913 / SG25) TaxID=1329250 RepID=A0A069CVK9_WEIOS|nr:TIM barrel protein [Weissella oryzae]GAK31795.1 sugar phosphate isomerase [Weissella oryzae SG25]
MNVAQIVLNNLVFDKEHQAGENQLTMLKKALEFNISQVELRREYFFDIENEIKDIKNFTNTHGIKLFYSVPDELFINGELNTKLDMYFAEAQAMGVSVIKFNIGEFDDIRAKQLEKLAMYSKILDQMNIENNQIKSMGSISAIQKFMEIMVEHDLAIGYVYDMGNWRYVGENEMKAAQALRQYVKYIHVKDGLGFASDSKTVPLGQGEIDWPAILAILPKMLPVALEYPVNSDLEIIDGIERLKAEGLT